MILREYTVAIRLNGHLWRRVFISDHYEERHKEHMTDALVLKLLKAIDGEHFPVQAVRPDGHRILKADPVFFNGKSHRLIMTFHPDADYLGVINAFRRRLK